MTQDQQLLDLQNQISRLSSQLAAAQQEIQDLKKLITQNPTTTPTPEPASLPPTPSTPSTDKPDPSTSESSPPPPWRDPKKLAKIKHPSPAESAARKLRRAEASARFFQPPSTNQGFTFVYYHTKTHLPPGTLRTHLKRLGVNNGRVLDIHYPSSNIVAFLVHLDFLQEFRTHLKSHSISEAIDFNPYIGDYLCDPQFQTMSSRDKDDAAFRIQLKRAERIILKLRPSVRYAVAAYFHEIGDITPSFWHKLKQNQASTKSTSPSLASMVLE